MLTKVNVHPLIQVIPRCEDENFLMNVDHHQARSGRTCERRRAMLHERSSFSKLRPHVLRDADRACCENAFLDEWLDQMILVVRSSFAIFLPGGDAEQGVSGNMQSQDS